MKYQSHQQACSLHQIMSLTYCNTFFLLGFLTILLSGCGAEKINNDAQLQMKNGNYEKALQLYQQGIHEYPEDVPLRAGLVSSQETIFAKLINAAATAHTKGNDALADNILQRALAINPNDDRAKAMLLDIQRTARQKEAIASVNDLISKGFTERATLAIESALKENPKNEELLELKRQLELTTKQADQISTQLAETRPISLDFRDANLRMILEVLTRNSGINFVMDKEVKQETRATVFLKNAHLIDALELLTTTNQLGYKILDTNSVLIYPKTPEKSKEYEDLMIRAFYLSNANAKQTAQLLKSTLKIHEPFVDEKLNMLIVRETPQTLRLAERVIALYDLSEPEVLLEVEVLEIQRNSLTNIGVDFPDTLTLTPLNSSSANSSSTSTGLTLNSLKALNKSTINLHKDISDANILTNPKLRTRNHEKAKIMVGDKLPIVTTTGSANNTGFISESVQYVDVGLKLDIEPTIYLDDDVGIKLALEVSSLVNTIKTTAGSTVYEIGTRNVETVLRLHDGETQLMAGLINNSEQIAAKKVPGLGDLPVLGRLFSSQSDNGQRSEIVLSITPHIIRNIRRPDITQAEFWSGTENELRSRPLTLPGRSKTDESNKNSTLPSTSSAPFSNIANSSPHNAIEKPADLVLSISTPAEVKTGDTFDVAFHIKANKSLRGIPIKIQFSPNSLEVVNVKEGTFFQQDGAKVNQSKSIDLGILNVGMLRSSADEIKGNGTLMNITFKALSSGTAEIKVISAKAISTEPIETSVTPEITKIMIK